MQTELRCELLDNIDANYKKFSSSLIPNIDNILGVRIPILRKIVKRNYKKYGNKILEIDPFYFEEFLALGLAISFVEEDFELKTLRVKNFIPKINNWALCDFFVSNLKYINKDKDKFFHFVLKYSNSKKEFELRFFYVVLLNYFFLLYKI